MEVDSRQRSICWAMTGSDELERSSVDQCVQTPGGKNSSWDSDLQGNLCTVLLIWKETCIEKIFSPGQQSERQQKFHPGMMPST